MVETTAAPGTEADATPGTKADATPGTKAETDSGTEADHYETIGGAHATTTQMICWMGETQPKMPYPPTPKTIEIGLTSGLHKPERPAKGWDLHMMDISGVKHTVFIQLCVPNRAGDTPTRLSLRSHSLPLSLPLVTSAKTMWSVHLKGWRRCKLLARPSFGLTTHPPCKQQILLKIRQW
jgi:hypothetical protein